ncbi:MAG: hypothetical protein WCK29_03460, partial [archaeon]
LINYNISDVQDIKLYIHNSSDDKIVRSEILSNTLNSGIWKDSWNYISSSFPDNLSYKIKLTSYSNNSSICVKLRKVNSSKTEELCKTFIQNLEPINSYKNLKPSKSSFSTDLENLRLGITLSSFILILLIFLILTLDIRDL